jgi:hypothetical protein
VAVVEIVCVVALLEQGVLAAVETEPLTQQQVKRVIPTLAAVAAVVV